MRKQFFTYMGNIQCKYAFQKKIQSKLKHSFLKLGVYIFKWLRENLLYFFPPKYLFIYLSIYPPIIYFGGLVYNNFP